MGGTSAMSSASTSRGVVEHGGELVGEEVELVVGQRQPGQAGHVGDVVAGDPVGLGHRSRLGGLASVHVAAGRRAVRSGLRPPDVAARPQMVDVVGSSTVATKR